MAERPVFAAQEKEPFVRTENTEFTFYPGFSVQQARRCVRSLHESFVRRHPEYAGRILEISSKSETELGVRLSAFNLLYTLPDGRRRPVECVFQAGKCFAGGRQYTELLDLPPAEAKRFAPLRESGEIIEFRLEDAVFPTRPVRFFYHWLYVSAFRQNPDPAREVLKYRAFTDIVFNPAKSLNCQAASAALYVALHEAGRLEEALRSPEAFREIVFPDSR